ncbi:MAG: hypothetical protein ACODAE_01900 [Gemmatimonadota bacterium]
MKCRIFLITISIALVTASPVASQTDATETDVLVRVLARGAKLIGDAVGGARITVTDVETGDVLASGITEGNTGDTELIMTRPREGDTAVFETPGAAGWLARLPLRRPTRVEITAEGPLDYPQATARSSKTLLLAPGEDVVGDGVVLELNGFIVELLEPAGAATGADIPVRARVRMLCSCPTAPDGLWSVEWVDARLISDGRVVAETPLEFSGETSIYTGRIRAPGPGSYTLEIGASDGATANFGTVGRRIEVPAAGSRRGSL